jgi:hypothetical protein
MTRSVYENFQMVMTNQIICSSMLMFRSPVIRSQHMTEDNNNEEYSSEAIHNKSKKGSQDRATQGLRGTRISRV